jgi:hypothetical protein
MVMCSICHLRVPDWDERLRLARVQTLEYGGISEILALEESMKFWCEMFPHEFFAVIDWVEDRLRATSLKHTVSNPIINQLSDP